MASSGRRRPTAFEVSFPEEVGSTGSTPSTQVSRTSTPVGARWGGRASPNVAGSAVAGPSAGARPTTSRASSSSSTVPSKRRGEEVDTVRAMAPRATPPPADAFYRPPSGVVPLKETEDIVFPGEDDGGDPGEDEDMTDDEDKLPIRVLNAFSIYDSRNRNQFVALDVMETPDGADRELAVVGYVKRYMPDENSEDVGQEDEDGELGVFMELSAVFRHTLEYTKWDDPIYIHTQYAWYILQTPSQEYSPFWEHFFSPKRVAQMVISSAANPSNSRMTLDDFLAKFTNIVDPFGHTYVPQDLWDAAPEIHEALQELPDYPHLAATLLIRNIFENYHPSAPKKKRPRPSQVPNQIPATRLTGGDPDLSVLKAENQNATHVTPRIHQLAKDLVNESLRVVGAETPQAPLEVRRQIAARKMRRVEEFLNKARRWKADVRWEKEDRVRVGSRFVKRIYIDKEKFDVGDAIVVANDTNPFWAELKNMDMSEPLPQLPRGTDLHDFFWFGRIHSLTHDTRKAHVQWFEHGVGILLQELAHDQHLYLTNLCGAIDLDTILGKVDVRYKVGLDSEEDPELNPYEYICNYTYNAETAAFTTVEPNTTEGADPPDNCPVCVKEGMLQIEKDCMPTRDAKGKKNGFAYMGNKFHIGDFVRYYADDGPANLGYMTDFEIFERRTSTAMGTQGVVTCYRVGRVSDLGSKLPADMLRDERHLFITGETVKVKINDLLGIVYVPTVESLKRKIKVEDWISLSPDHYYVTWRFPSMAPRSWNDKVRVRWPEHVICTPCWEEKLARVKEVKLLLKEKKKKPLNVLDLFGGVGTFSDGLAQGSGALKITHAIELSPSAAKTFKHNFPDAVVYNQCANTMLQYTLKTWNDHAVMQPCQLYDESVKVPPPPKKSNIQVITAGFPCQAHSAMNMFKNVNDVKNNLVLTALSWVDAIRPIYAFFENVAGFLQHRLKGTQAGAHKVEGGVEMGGLKILVRALLDMGYQVRFSLLQAAHYGTPQGRIRFFCIAARHGYPLPQLPQPTHAFHTSLATELKISLPYGLSEKQDIRPVRVAKGTGLHKMVTIDDAIGDLARFDWKHPNKNQRPRILDGVEVPLVECGSQKRTGSGRTQHQSGPREPVPEYHHAHPKTRYQLEARVKGRSAIEDLQHFTKVLPEKRVMRVLAIKMEPGADYRSLLPSEQEWQHSNAMSATARSNYKAGMYGRLDKTGVFRTIVTNVDPTAKQSRVLHPYCKRIVTVRELARGQGFPDHFKFIAMQGKPITMHRQIGNAVPYPLGRALGRELRESLLEKRLEGLKNSITIDSDPEPEGPDEDVQMWDAAQDGKDSDVEYLSM